MCLHTKDKRPTHITTFVLVTFEHIIHLHHHVFVIMSVHMCIQYYFNEFVLSGVLVKWWHVVRCIRNH